MTLPWGSDNGTCPDPVEQTLEDTWLGFLHMSLPHILPEGGREGGRKGGKKRKEEKIRMAMIHCKKNNTLTTFLGVSVASV